MLAESVSIAMLTVLETLGPTERAVVAVATATVQIRTQMLRDSAAKQ